MNMTPNGAQKMADAADKKLRGNPPLGLCGCKEKIFHARVVPFIGPAGDGEPAVSAHIFAFCQTCGVSIPYQGDVMFGKAEFSRMLKE